jgi:predicted ATPase
MHLRSVELRPERYPTRGRYPFSLPIFQEARRITFGTAVTFFVGENGTGKSTLLEALARPCGIHIWREPDGERYERNPYEEQLGDCVTVEWAAGSVPGAFFGADIFRHFTRLLDEWAAGDPGLLAYFGGRSLVTQSHGQSLMSYFRACYQIKGLYLLDEPEAALSPRSQLELLDILTRAGATGQGQFIIATHSPILMACPGATLYSFDQAPIRPVQYEETEHYRIYRRFMQDRRAYLPEALGPMVGTGGKL